MASEEAGCSWKKRGGLRRGAGRKKKYDANQDDRVVNVKLDREQYRRWLGLKDRLKLKSNNQVAEYLLNMAEAFDEQPSTVRYVCLALALLLGFFAQ